MIKLRTLLFGLFATLASLSAYGAAALELKPGTQLEVVLSSHPTPAEEYAARELSTYLGKLLKTEIPVRKQEERESPSPQGRIPLYLGWQQANADLKPEALATEEAVVDIHPDKIRIVGGRAANASGEVLHDRGTLYGAYDLLNELGVRWFRPEPWGEFVPEQPSYTLAPGPRRSKPVYKYRYGINIYQTFYPHPDTMTAEERKQNAAEWEMVQKWGVRNRLNTNLRNPGEQGGSYRINFAHAYRYLLPPEIHYANHPEYYALINGKRSSDPQAQLCLSNPEVQELVYQNLRKTMLNNPTQEIVSVGPNDGHLWCECQPCSAMDDPELIAAHNGKVSKTNRVVAFANTMAEKLGDEFPDKKLGWYAYSAETEAPTKVKELKPNTAVMVVAFAGAFSDYSRPFCDSSSRQNKLFRKVLGEWKELASRSGSELLTHDYWSFYLWPGPLPVVHTMTDRLQHYHRDFGVVGQYSETHPCWGPQGINYYFYTWLLRNPYGDVDAEKEIYYKGYYGPAAEPMRAYHEQLEAAAQKGPYFGSGGYQIENLFTQEFLDILAPSIKQAITLAEGREPFAQRVGGVAAGFEYAQRFRRFLTLRSEGKINAAIKQLEDLAAYFKSFEDGSVFDVRTSNRGTMTTIFDRHRREIDKAAAKFALFEQPKVVQQHEKKWRFQIDPQEQGISLGWHAAGDDSQWAQIDAGKTWQEQGFPDFKGTAWYRKTWVAPSAVSGKRMILWFDAIDGSATVYLNGEEIFQRPLGKDGEGYDEPFYVDITDIVKPAQENRLALRVRKDRAVGGVTRGVYILRVDSIRAPVE